MLTVGSCFSGIGGLELGLEWTGGFKTEWQIENDKYASAVLKKHWPGVQRYADIRGVSFPEKVDLICGGFPCQDVSLAGSRKGLEGKRSTLWGEMLRLVRDVRPRWVVVENVPGLLSSDDGRFFGTVLRDLAGAGYDAEWGVLSAAGVGAPHLRKRIFIVAYATRPEVRSGHKKNGAGEPDPAVRLGNGGGDVAHARRGDGQGSRDEERVGPVASWWQFEPRVGGRADGFPVWIYQHCGRGLSYAESKRRSQVLSDLWNPNIAKEIQRYFGGLGRMEAAEVLFAFVREHEADGRIPREQLASEKALKRIVRDLRNNKAPSCPPQKSGPERQPARERGDALRDLSRFTSPWEAGIERIMNGIPSRVDRLKCLGNAVVPQVAQKVGEMILRYEESQICA